MLSRRRTGAALAAAASLAAAAFVPAPGRAQETAAVEMTFLGNMGFRFTAPDGTVVLTDPWLEGNPDAPIGIDDVDDADLILVSGAHGDNIGDAVPLAKKTGATVIATAELGAWMRAAGVAGGQIHAMMPGGLYRRAALSVKVLQAVHTAGFWPPGEATPGYGGVSIGFLLTFGNGLRVYFSGDTALFGDMRMFGALYRPHVAILSARGRYMMEPEDAAHAAAFLATDNPGLATVVPAHHRVGAGRIAERLSREIERLGLEVTVLEPAPGKTYELRP